LGADIYPFDKIEGLLAHFYRAGARIVYLQGGEVMTWRDGARNVNHVIRRAKEIGFFKVAVVTNCTLGVSSEADLMWVSLDGSRAVHDAIRGPAPLPGPRNNLEETRHARKREHDHQPA
jgi:MoaA/NifB/PqqE/SkfB family radical SAM enzyme